MASLGDQRAGPLSGRSFSVDGFSMVPAPDAARFVFRARGVAVDTAGRAFGVDLPRHAFRTSATSARTARGSVLMNGSCLGPNRRRR